MKNILSFTGLCLLMAATTASAQDDLYVAPTGNFVTFAGAQVGVFGNLINDARGTAATASTANTGFNHNGGGDVYLYRRTSGNSRIYDGTDNSLYGTGTSNYNAGGKAVRFYNLYTDNTVGTATASGTGINTTSGSAQIQLEQEVCVSNLLTAVNGMIWTPRGAWKHAYLHLDNNAAAAAGNMAASNTAANAASAIHVDGYVARTGNSNFTFPIGDGAFSRFAGIASPVSAGTFKAAYFRKDPNALGSGSGLSGSATQGSTASMHGGITKVSTAEFWDIDGTAPSQFTLYAFNSGGYSGWNSDFSAVSGGAPGNLVIAALDDWENLATATAPAAYSSDGAFTTHAANTTPDGGSTITPATGNAFVAYTWAMAPTSFPLPIQLSSFSVIANACNAELHWTSSEEKTVESYLIEHSKDGQVFNTVATLLPQGTNKHYTYSYEQGSGKGYYRLRIRDVSGAVTNSSTLSVNTDCGAAHHIDVYPNPVSSTLNIRGLSVGQTIMIYGVAGQLIRFDHASSAQYSADLSTYAPGTYTVFVRDGDRYVAAVKVVKL